ncbi:MOSC domain-containing protein, partial [Rhodovulum sulfidophilum]|nr:MOSC domain-containing protein [Rhodovulum sulfidophilum]
LTRIVRAPGRGMTDSAFPSVSLLGLASLEALSGQLGQALSPLRFRGNFWIEGLAPFAEFDWVGRKIRLGRAVIEVRERITRCMATAANPETGERDADTLGALQAGWGHKQFGVYAEVIEGGRVALGDALEAL